MPEDKFPDARIGREVPAQVLLGEEVKQRVKELGAKVASYVQEKIHEEISPNFVAFNDMPRVAVSIGEIDELKLGSILYSPEAGMTVLDLNTFADRSPFMYGEDVGISEVLTNTYDVICMPEHPPFIVHCLRLGKDIGNPATVRKYLQEVREGKQPPPHILDNEQATQVIAMLQSPEIENYIDYEEGLMSAGSPES